MRVRIKLFTLTLHYPGKHEKPKDHCLGKERFAKTNPKDRLLMAE